MTLIDTEVKKYITKKIKAELTIVNRDIRKFEGDFNGEDFRALIAKKLEVQEKLDKV